MEGFQKRQVSDPKKAKDVWLAAITYAEDGQTVACSCGAWVYNHKREKVREDAIDRHLARKHDGRGVRL